MKLEFYEILYQNDRFCMALGRVMLAASKLEIQLKQYLRLHGHDVSERRATLGNLIGVLERDNRLTSNGLIHFKSINDKRNYLIHNLYGSFVGEIEDEMLPVENLVDEDVDVYSDRAEMTSYDFGVYSTIVSKAIKQFSERDEERVYNPPLL